MWLSRFFGFFSKSKTKKPFKEQSGEQKQVEFNKKLIKDLIKEHKILLSNFTGMISSVQTDNFDNANHLLGVFATKIVAHLEVEAKELYFYLEFEANVNQEDKLTMRDFRNEMSGIATAVTGFINSYTNDPISAKNKDQFLEDANNAATVLVDRISREEGNLYPMYGRYKK